MMMVIVESSADAFAAGVTRFLTSLTWLYLRHRYPVVAQGNLLKALTLSGLDPMWWERCAACLIAQQGANRSLHHVFMAAHDERTQDEFRDAVEAIWAYAAVADAPIGEPPPAPVYLTGYGYTPAAYLADLERLYGGGVVARYQQLWVEEPTALQRAPVQPDFLFRPAVAIMGATAGAIERLMAIGASYAEPNNEPD